MTKRINIMAGTSPEGQGGIATVIKGYIDYGLFEQNDIQFIATHHSSITNRLGMMLFFGLALLKLLWLGTTQKIGWVHVHLASRGSYMRKRLFVALAKKLGAKVILHLHGGEFSNFYDSQSKGKQREIAAFFRTAEKVLTLSGQTARWVESITGENSNIQVLFNTVPDFKAPNPMPPVVPHSILFLGNIVKLKGIFDLLPAFARLLKAYPDAKLRIGGTGELEKLTTQIKELGIENQVTLLGWIAGEQKNQELAQADVFCLPSYKEGMPMSVLEAMSAGKAIVSTPVGGIPEIIYPDKNGLLFTPGDIESLYQCLYTLLADNENKLALANAAREYFSEHLCEPVIFGQLQDIYHSLDNQHQ